jgi:hypothetical protein
MLKLGLLDHPSRDAIMTRRRLRLPAAIALFAVAAPVLATQPGSPARESPAAMIRSSAHEFGAAVKQGSTEFGHRVAHGAREAGQQFHAGMQQGWDTASTAGGTAFAATSPGPERPGDRR